MAFCPQQLFLIDRGDADVYVRDNGQEISFEVAWSQWLRSDEDVHAFLTYAYLRRMGLIVRREKEPWEVSFGVWRKKGHVRTEEPSMRVMVMDEREAPPSVPRMNELIDLCAPAEFIIAVVDQGNVAFFTFRHFAKNFQGEEIQLDLLVQVMILI